jgi:hypothetical protein
MRKWLVRVLAVGLCAAIIDRLAWVVATRALVSGLDRWEDQARAHGWTVSEGGRFVSGWPFGASLTISKVEIAGGEHALPGGIRWEAGRTILSVSLTAPFTLQVEPQGQEVIRLSHMQPIVFNTEHILARSPLGRRQDQEGWLTAQGVTGGIVGSGHPQDVRLESLTLHLRVRDGKTDGVAGELELAARGIDLPDIGRWPLGATVASLGGTLQLSSPNIASGQGAREEAAAWRDGGGRVSLHDGALRWGPLGLRGEAQLGLDGRLQPAGNGTADISGAAAALDALVDAKVIAPGIGATGKAVLSVMPAAPGSTALRLPFVLRDNTLSVGPIPLARLNDVKW